LFDTVNGTIAGLAVVEDNNMPDNQLVVGDRRLQLSMKNQVLY
jgi:hypothetical protein